MIICLVISFNILLALTLLTSSYVFSAHSYAIVKYHMVENISKFSYSHCLGKEASDYKVSVGLREKTWLLICQFFLHNIFCYTLH